jgi:peroxiredoxin Q/BCP
MLEIGDKAPLFCLHDADNKEVCLNDFNGRWVVLYFYPKDQTPGCTKEACDFTANLNLFQDLNAVILGVSADSTESHTDFIQKENITFPLLSDENFNVIEAYGAKDSGSILSRLMNVAKRMTFLIDPEGNIAHIWSKVKVSGHTFDVHDTLKKLIENRKG